MKENYNYPIDLTWTEEELYAVMNLLQAVEKAYEIGIDAKEVLRVYRIYKEHFKAIQDEKRLDKSFKEASGYSVYQVIKSAKVNDGKIKLSL